MVQKLLIDFGTWYSTALHATAWLTPNFHATDVGFRTVDAISSPTFSMDVTAMRVKCAP